MPAPLPKPATPKLPNPGGQTSATPPAVPPQQPMQMVGGRTPVTAAPLAKPPQATAPSVPAKTPSMPPVQVSPAPAVSAAPPKMPATPPSSQLPPVPRPAVPSQVPVGSPSNSPAPTSKPLTAPPVQASSQVGAPVKPSMPLAAKLNQPAPMPGRPAQPVRIQQPPQTLTALSSMASNRLPAGGATPAAPTTGAPASSTGQQPLSKNAQAPKTAEFVQPKKSILRFWPYLLGGVLLLVVISFVALRFLGSSTTSVSTNKTPSGSTGTTGGTASTGKQVTLEYWGLWEPSESMDEVIKDYQSKNPGVTIKYSKQSYKDYRTRLESAITSGNGPDIFRFHATWVPMLKDELSPLPSSVMSTTEFQTTFYPVAVQQLQLNSQIVGIPLEYDGLVLYYNTDIFKTAVLDPPKTWADLRTIASKLTIKSGDTIKRAGLAAGNAVNVDNFSDILGVLMLQNNADLTKPASPEVRDALLFYTNFMKTDGVWSDALPNSTVAFSRGDVAMMFGPSWRALDIKTMNPNLNFATTPLPQLSDKRITWGSYWAEGVSNKSKNKDEAWKFLKYLSTKDVQQKLVSAQAQTRAFGEIYSRKDLGDTLAKDPILASYVQDAPYAQGWYVSSLTHDAGLNDQLIQYYQDAVTSIVGGKSVEEAQKTLEQGVNQVLRQYGVVTQTAPTTTTK